MSPAIDFHQPIPLFPLPECVLLPHATIPLYIFEPRYRKMVADALADNRLLAMAVLARSPSKPFDPLQPPIRPHVCIGYIVKHQKTSDGCYHILLQGLCRARLICEVPHQPYRLGLLEPLESTEPDAMEIDFLDARRQLETLLHDPLLQQLLAIRAIHNWLSDEVPTLALIDLAILSTTDNTEERYLMLAQPDPAQRLTWLLNHLQHLRHTLELAGRLEPQLSDEGICPN